MKNWTIGKRIILGFATIISISLILGVFSYTRVTSINHQSNLIANTSVPISVLCGEMKYNLRASLLAIFQHIGSSDKADMAKLDDSIKNIGKRQVECFEQLEKLVANDAKARELLDKVIACRPDYAKTMNATMEISRKGNENAKAYEMARTDLETASNRLLKKWVFSGEAS